MRRLAKLAEAVGYACLTIVGFVIGLILTPLAAIIAIPVWAVAVVPLWVFRLVSRRQLKLTLPSFMAYAAQLVATAVSRTVLRRFHAGNLEEWPWHEPPRRLREGLI